MASNGDVLTQVLNRPEDSHALVSDPPANVLTRMTRHTCAWCGATKITRPDGTVYGSAVERECPGQGEG